MAALIRRMSASHAVIAGLLVVSGCSTEEAASRPTATPTTEAPSRPSRPVLTAEQLKALALRDSEVPQAESVPVQDPVPEGERRNSPPVSDASCQRIFEVHNAENASAVVLQIFNWKKNIMGGGSTLASYDEAMAEGSFQQLHYSITNCKSFTGVGPDGKFKAKITFEKAPDVGDEALSFHLIIPLPDGRGLRDEHHVFVRTGNVTASFEELNVGEKAQFPLGLITKQVDRLTKRVDRLTTAQRA
ncbi:hypothetical protein ACFYYR_20320 [Streptomyces sp. NPDC001922]|uniref:hypothetical protein n=1 Tax=Streptomyces sp. NPDC001922 TaxID=3364624 RepID=UPI0036D1F10E